MKVSHARISPVANGRLKAGVHAVLPVELVPRLETSRARQQMLLTAPQLHRPQSRFAGTFRDAHGIAPAGPSARAFVEMVWPHGKFGVEVAQTKTVTPCQGLRQVWHAEAHRVALGGRGPGRIAVQAVDLELENEA
mmetsp:Transcript_86440/g.152993  ORF Transcript_86440/g.152993 Transcript_86440/m.152993 type:complete len:136 (-) Transcript_86440:4345-4752(-)